MAQENDHHNQKGWQCALDRLAQKPEKQSAMQKDRTEQPPKQSSFEFNPSLALSLTVALELLLNQPFDLSGGAAEIDTIDDEIKQAVDTGSISEIEYMLHDHHMAVSTHEHANPYLLVSELVQGHRVIIIEHPAAEHSLYQDYSLIGEKFGIPAEKSGVLFVQAADNTFQDVFLDICHSPIEQGTIQYSFQELILASQHSHFSMIVSEKVDHIRSPPDQTMYYDINAIRFGYDESSAAQFDWEGWYMEWSEYHSTWVSKKQVDATMDDPYNVIDFDQPPVGGNSAESFRGYWPLCPESTPEPYDPVPEEDETLVDDTPSDDLLLL